MPQFALLLCLTLGIMGMLTPYATGPSPVYYGSGYLPGEGLLAARRDLRRQAPPAASASPSSRRWAI